MLRLKCTIVNKQGAYIPDYFSCYSSKTLYANKHLLFTKQKFGLVGMVGYQLPLHVAKFKIFLTLSKVEWGYFKWSKFDLGCWNLPKCS